MSLPTLAGCCTSCAVRVKSGELNQPQALGISAELKSQVISLFDVARNTSIVGLREKLGPTLIKSTKKQYEALTSYSVVMPHPPK